MAKSKPRWTSQTQFMLTEHATMKGSRISNAVGIVEADNYARHMLWREYSFEAGKLGISGGSQIFKWEQEGEGFLERIGTFGGMPVNLDITFARIDDKLIMFWDMCSMVTHSEMAENFLRMVNPTAKFSNATNFCNALR